MIAAARLVPRRFLIFKGPKFSWRARGHEQEVLGAGFAKVTRFGSVAF